MAIITHALATTRLGPYQLQAAIAAVHDEAPDADATDWPQVLALYGLLDRLAPNPMVTLNRAVAARHGGGAARRGSICWTPSPATTAWPTTIASTPCGPTCWRWRGTSPGPAPATCAPARRTTSAPERRFLDARAARLTDDTP